MIFGLMHTAHILQSTIDRDNPFIKEVYQQHYGKDYVECCHGYITIVTMKAEAYLVYIFIMSYVIFSLLDFMKIEMRRNSMKFTSSYQ